MVNEFDQIRLILDGIHGPQPTGPNVVGTRFELGADQADDAAVFVTVLLDNATKSEDWISANLEPIAERVRAAIRTGGVPRWPYVRFATPADLKAAG